MEHVEHELIIEDLVKFGEDRGFDRGVKFGEDRGEAQGRLRVYENLVEEHLGRPLRPEEKAALGRRSNSIKMCALLRESPTAVEVWLKEPDTM